MSFKQILKRPLSWTLLNNPPWLVFLGALVLLYVPILLIRIFILGKRSLSGLFGPYIAWWAGEITWCCYFLCVAYILRHGKGPIPAWMNSQRFHIPVLAGSYCLGILNRIRAIQAAKNQSEVDFFNQPDQKFHDFITFGFVMYLCDTSLPLVIIRGTWQVQLAKIGMVISLIAFGVTWTLDRPGDTTRFTTPLPN